MLYLVGDQLITKSPYEKRRNRIARQRAKAFMFALASGGEENHAWRRFRLSDGGDIYI